MTRAWLPAVLSVMIVPAGLFAAEKDLLQDVKDRNKVEAERVESEFARERASAYKLVRSDTPNLVDATEKLQGLLSLLENDTSLDSKRRQTLIVTVKWDLDKVKEIVAERRRTSVAKSTPPPSVVRRDTPRRDYDEDRRRAGNDAKSVIESRRRDLADARRDRLDRADRFNRVMRSVDESAVPETREYVLPRDWAEKSRKRSAGIKMTAREKAIMDALNRTLEADFSANSLGDVIDYFKKKTGIEIVVDKRGLEDAGVTYESQINLKMKASARTVIKRVFADLGLAYYIKDEAMQVTSRERASQMTTTRTYYIGDLAQTVDIRLGGILTQLQMIETVNRIITLIKTNVEPKSWKDNNPEAPGAIYFDPVSMSLVVKQTAEVHFMMAGK